MTNIYDLGMTDTEYAQLAAQGYDPNLELQLIELGESPDRLLATFGDLGWGKAEGRGQKAEGKKKEEGRSNRFKI